MTINLIDQDREPVFEEGLTVPPGDVFEVGVGVTDSYFAILGPTGETLADVSLPQSELDRDGDNPFPPLLIPHALCG